MINLQHFTKNPPGAHMHVRNGSGEGFLGCRGVLGTPNDAPFATVVAS